MHGTEIYILLQISNSTTAYRIKDGEIHQENPQKTQQSTLKLPAPPLHSKHSLKSIDSLQKVFRGTFSVSFQHVLLRRYQYLPTRTLIHTTQSARTSSTHNTAFPAILVSSSLSILNITSHSLHLPASPLPTSHFPSTGIHNVPRYQNPLQWMPLRHRSDHGLHRPHCPHAPAGRQQPVSANLDRAGGTLLACEMRDVRL